MKINYNLIFIIYLVLLVLLAILPINSTSTLKLDNFNVQIRLDYIFHFLVYCPFIFLFNTAHKLKAINIILIGILFGLFTEFVQYFLPYRSFNINDLIANALGVLLGLIVFIPFVYRFISKFLFTTSVLK